MELGEWRTGGMSVLLKFLQRVGAREKRGAPVCAGTPAGLLRFCGAVAGYCVGLSNCVKPVVLTSRKSGVRGGSREGFRKLVSKA